uniref:Uncharacterized protein n=1 Tax=Romanomermis culicivorax TaxID=13658 RepID=A0A915IC84_ROMCU
MYASLKKVSDQMTGKTSTKKDCLKKRRNGQKKGNEPEADEATNSRVDSLELKFDTLMALVKNSIMGNQTERVEGQLPLAKQVEGGEVDTPKAKKKAAACVIKVLLSREEKVGAAKMGQQLDNFMKSGQGSKETC